MIGICASLIRRFALGLSDSSGLSARKGRVIKRPSIDWLGPTPIVGGLFRDTTTRRLFVEWVNETVA